MENQSRSQSQETVAGNPLLRVLIRDREGILFEGEAEAVSSYSDKGPFDILPYHANFITLINKEIRVKRVGGEEKTVITSGVLIVRENKVEIYVGILPLFLHAK